MGLNAQMLLLLFLVVPEMVMHLAFHLVILRVSDERGSSSHSLYSDIFLIVLYPGLCNLIAGGSCGGSNHGSTYRRSRLTRSKRIEVTLLLVLL